MLNTQKILFVYIFFFDKVNCKTTLGTKNNIFCEFCLLFLNFFVSRQRSWNVLLLNAIAHFNLIQYYATSQWYDYSTLERASEILSSGDTDFVFIFLMKRKITFWEFTELSLAIYAMLKENLECVWNSQGASVMRNIR